MFLYIYVKKDECSYLLYLGILLDNLNAQNMLMVIRPISICYSIFWFNAWNVWPNVIYQRIFFCHRFFICWFNSWAFIKVNNCSHSIFWFVSMAISILKSPSIRRGHCVVLMFVWFKICIIQNLYKLKICIVENLYNSKLI